VVPYQNSPFFVSAIDAAPFFKVGFPAGLMPGSPRLSGFAWRPGESSSRAQANKRKSSALKFSTAYLTFIENMAQSSA
ncbi:hypothetical protein ACVBEH_27420, partial [Roseateles sp. GG27B]